MKVARNFSFIFFALGLWLLPHLSLAQQNAGGITLVPAMIEEAADPGSTIERTLTVTNESDEEREYFVYKKNIKGVENGGVPIFAEEESEKTGYEIAEWIQIPTEPIKIPAEQSMELPIKIVVPENATPGSHFGGIFISAEPPRLREIGAGVGYEVVSVISIRISGATSDLARIRAFSPDKLVYGKKDVKFSIRVENQGNILIRPRGPIAIKSMFSSEPMTVNVNETLAGVFPSATRDFEAYWKSDELGFGRYEAVIALSYDGDGGQKTIDASASFWIFPTKIVLGVLGVFLFIVIGGYLLTRYYINQAIMRAAGGRRIAPQRYRKQAGVSRFTFIFIVLMSAFVVFLLLILVVFA